MPMGGRSSIPAGRTHFSELEVGKYFECPVFQVYFGVLSPQNTVFGISQGRLLSRLIFFLPCCATTQLITQINSSTNIWGFGVRRPKIKQKIVNKQLQKQVIKRFAFASSSAMNATFSQLFYLVIHC